MFYKCFYNLFQAANSDKKCRYSVLVLVLHGGNGRPTPENESNSKTSSCKHVCFYNIYLNKVILYKLKKKTKISQKFIL